MNPVYYRKWFIRVSELWFDGKGCPSDSDIVRYMHVPDRVEGALCDEWYTLVISLSSNEDEILKSMDDGTRYEIRRSLTKDDLRYQHVCPSNVEDVREFMAAYEREMVPQNGASRLVPERLVRMAEVGLLDLSTMKDNAGHTLSWHVHVVTAGIARLFYSVSATSTINDQQQKNLRGRANRLHHWMDMLRFRNAGYAKYDFGGYCPETADAKKSQISRFKRGFGGQVAVTYNCVYPLTVTGKIALAGWRYFGAAAGSTVGPHEET